MLFRKGFPDGSGSSPAGEQGRVRVSPLSDFTSGVLLRKTNNAHPGRRRDRHQIPKIRELLFGFPEFRLKSAIFLRIPDSGNPVGVRRNNCRPFSGPRREVFVVARVGLCAEVGHTRQIGRRPGWGFP
jgi:hypothetical protein